MVQNVGPDPSGSGCTSDPETLACPRCGECVTREEWIRHPCTFGTVFPSQLSQRPLQPKQQARRPHPPWHDHPPNEEN